MEVGKSNIFKVLDGTTQFIIPVYQRAYSWTAENCDQLWRDIVSMQKNNRSGHFVGSIVNIAEQAMPTGVSKFMIIDGQQRLTTLTLLLLALRDYAATNPDKCSITQSKFNKCLKNADEVDEDQYKIIPTKKDREVLFHLIEGISLEGFGQSKLISNYRFFYDKISSNELSPAQIYEATGKLQIVNITLDRQYDDPQLIFESLNSTGVDLSQSDLIRNYILMGLEPEKQKNIFAKYWNPMEALFSYEKQTTLMDRFFRDYLTVILTRIPKEGKVYDEFKQMHRVRNIDIDELCLEIYNYAHCYTNLIYAKSGSPDLDAAFRDILDLKMEVAYPFILKVYRDYEKGMLSEAEFIVVLRLCESYVFRRAICEIPTNSLNKTFATFQNNIVNTDYFNSVKAHFRLLDSYKEFPDNDRFAQSFASKEIYRMRTCHYILAKLENFDNKAHVSLDNLTIEHIMPENKNPIQAWKDMLGPDWKDVHKKYLHTIGNLTLTAYNSEMSDRAFDEKMQIKGGFKESALRINAFVVEQEVWTQAQIEQRGELLSQLALKIWQYPEMTDAQFAPYKPEDKAQYTLERFSWNALTRMLFENINAKIINLSPEIRCECTKHYVAYKYDTNFADIVIQKDGLKIVVNMNFNSVDDPKNICRDITGVGSLGNGNVEVFFHSLSQIDDIMHIVRQSFEAQSEVQSFLL